MKNVLIVGAGRLGKGFIGETFDNAGWNITFLDKDPKVEEELKKQGCYHVKVHRVDEMRFRTELSRILKHTHVMKSILLWMIFWKWM